MPDTGPIAMIGDVTDEHRHTARLIELGRDREAAELGAATALGVRQDPPTGGAMEPLEQLDELGPVLGGVVSTITPEQLDNATPCANFTVRGVLDHMIGGATAFAAAFRGQEPTEADTSDVLAGFGPALTNLVDAITSPGALDRTVKAPFGEVPGETFARFVVLDGLVHGWDIATATGESYTPSDALVADVQAFADDAIDPLRDGDTFADATEVPPSATPIERLVAFTGRKVP